MKKIIYILAVIVLFSSCEDALKETVNSSFASDNFFKTEEHLLTAAVGMQESYRHVWWDFQFMSEIERPSKYFTSRTKDAKSLYKYSVTDGGINGTWQTLFRCINRANGIIKYAPDANVTQTVIDQHIAEARFWRAWCYYTLVRCYGAVPMHLEPVETLAEDQLFKAREPVLNIYYELIIPDLEYASQNLPIGNYEYNSVTSQPAGRPRQATAIIALGEAHMTMAGAALQDDPTTHYNAAVTVLKDLIDNESAYDVELLSDWSSIFALNNETNKEKLLALGATYDQQYGGMTARFTQPRYSVNAAGQGGNYEWALTLDLVDSYEPTDVRYQQLIFEYVSKRGDTVRFNRDEADLVSSDYTKQYHYLYGVCTDKWRDPDATRNVVYSNDKIMMRYVEAHLLLAEAYNELGQGNLGLPYLNIMRQRVNASDITETDQALLREIIRMERARELHFEVHALFDIRRWGTGEENFNNHLIKFMRDDPSDVWSDHYNLWPIPQAERDRYEGKPGMDQNPGW